jgi:hypothetical protein
MFAGKRRMMRERNAKVVGLLMVCFFSLLMKNGFDLFLLVRSTCFSALCHSDSA